MKIKLLAMVLCSFLMVFILTGCGKKTQESPSASPSGDVSSSPAGGTQSETITVIGIVSVIDNGTMKLNLVVQDDAPESDDTQTLQIGQTSFVITGGTDSFSTDAETAVLLEYRGFISGSLSDIAEGDFLAVVLRGNTATAIFDVGPAGDYDAGSSSGSPSDEPDDTDAGASPGVPDSATETAYTVLTDGLKVRSGPGTENSALGVLDTGSRVTGTVSDGWLEFSYNGKTAYCSAEYLEVSTAPDGVPDSSQSKTYKTTENLQARNGPGTTYSALGTLDKGAKLTGTILGGWLKFTYNDQTAYCSAAYLTEG